MEGRFKPLRPRACDACRKRKIRCDGLETTGRNCSHCASTGLTCTFISMSKRRAPTKAYTESLETRMTLMQRLLEKHATHAELEKELGFPLLVDEPGPSSPRRSPSVDDMSTFDSGRPNKWDASELVHVVNQIYTAENDNDNEDRDGLALYNDIGETARLTARMTDESATRYHGESSAWKFLRIFDEMGKDRDATKVTKIRTSVPWANELWFKALFQDETYRSLKIEFPEDDLMRHLVDLYFRRVNRVFPVIYEVSFRSRFTDNLHKRDRRFGHLLLSVLAVASLYSTDQRATEEVEGVAIPGQRFFEQVKDWNKTLAAAALPDLQSAFLLTLYRWALGQMHEAWISLGVGIRFAQDVGAHRQFKIRSEPDAIEAEEWKRCFWCFTIFDRFVSSSLGQPLIVHEEDVDLETPAPYPGDGNLEDIACIEFLKLTLRLGSFLTIALRVIYAVRPPEVPAEAKIVEQLDLALDRWLVSVPNEYQWNPDVDDILSLERSGQLMCDYYYTVIMIHRPLISREPDHYPGLDICTEAASACLRVLAVMAERLVLLSPHLCYTAWACGIVLLTKMWMLQQMDPPEDIQAVQADLRMCIKVLKTVARKWTKTERMIDILFELAQRGGIPLTHPKAGSRRQSPSAQASGAPSKAPSRHASPPPPQLPKSNEAIAPPPAPLPPSYALFPQHSQQPTPAISPWVNPAAVPLPEDPAPLYGPTEYFNAPAQFYQGLQQMASYQLQPQSNFGVNAFGESLFGTWFQAPPPEADPRFQMPEGPGWDAWSSYLAGVDVYAATAGIHQLAAPDFMSGAGVSMNAMNMNGGIFPFANQQQGTTSPHVPPPPSSIYSSASSVPSSRPGTSSSAGMSPQQQQHLLRQPYDGVMLPEGYAMTGLH